MLDFEDLVRRHQGAVCATAYAVLRDRARSEEVAQDAFLIAWRQLASLPAPPTLPAWICGIARNLARNASRKRRETTMASTPDLPSTSTALDTLLDREASEIAARALDSLGERDREVVVMYYRGEESVAEVAAALGITEPTARQRLHRGRERLRSAAALVEATLRRTRPSAAFTIACVAALAVGKVTPAAAAAPSTSWVPLAIGGVLAVTIGGAVVWRGTQASSSQAIAGRQVSEATGAGGPSMPSIARARRVVERIDATERVEMLERVRAALARTRSAAASSSGGADDDHVKVYDFSDNLLVDVAPADPPEPAVLSKQTLRYGIQLIYPLLLDCHPSPGTFPVKLRLAGAPDVGTLVDSVELTGDLAATASSCLRQTLMTIELPPMLEAGTWDVVYPLVVPAN